MAFRALGFPPCNLPSTASSLLFNGVSTPLCLYRFHTLPKSCSSSSSFSTPPPLYQINGVFTNSTFRNLFRFREIAFAAGENLGSEVNSIEEHAADPSPSATGSSPDVFTICIKADGMIDNEAIPNIKKALEQVDNVSNVTVVTTLGNTAVELQKSTSSAETGAASSLVETMLNAGFRLHTLSFSIDWKETVDEVEEERTSRINFYKMIEELCQ